MAGELLEQSEQRNPFGEEGEGGGGGGGGGGENGRKNHKAIWLLLLFSSTE